MLPALLRMDSFKRLFRPVVNAADTKPLTKKNPFHVEDEANDNGQGQDDYGGTPNIHIHRHKIPTKGISFKMKDLKEDDYKEARSSKDANDFMKDDLSIIRKDDEEEEFGLRSGAILSSGSSNYSFVSSDGPEDAGKTEPKRLPIEIMGFDDRRNNVFKIATPRPVKPQLPPNPRAAKSPKAILSKTNYSDLPTKIDAGIESGGLETSNSSSIQVLPLARGDVLVQLKSLIHRYDDVLLDLDSRLERMHESLLCDLISHDD